MIKVTDETRRDIVRLYRNPELTIKEIENILGVSEFTIHQVCRPLWESGELKPRNESCRTRSNEPKLTYEEMAALAEIYYTENITAKEFMQRHNLNTMNLHKIRQLFGKEYGRKAVMHERKSNDR